MKKLKKLKKICLFLIVAILLFQPFGMTKAFATSLARGTFISETDLREVEKGVGVYGKFPIVENLADESFQTELNNSLLKYKEEKITEVLQSSSQSSLRTSVKNIYFSYEENTFNDIKTILIYTKSSEQDTEDVVKTFSFDTQNCTMVYVTDVLGANAYSIVDDFILDTIRRSPDKFNTTFKTVGDNLNFSFFDNTCEVYFDKYKIAPGYEGIVKFTINLDNFKEVTVAKSEYYKLAQLYNLKMIPLRTVCEGLGYEVKWDEATNGVMVTQGNFYTKVLPNKNSYAIGANKPRELEIKPQLLDGKMYLPISFFDSILDVTYSVDDDNNIVFSQYRAK